MANYDILPSSKFCAAGSSMKYKVHETEMNWEIYNLYHTLSALSNVNHEFIPQSEEIV